MTNAFITGSRAFGTPRQDSDVDLVVLVSKEDAQTLFAQFYDTEDKASMLTKLQMAMNMAPNSFPLHIGKLNLIVCSDEKVYNGWLAGTASLKAQAMSGTPATRDDAIKVFNELGVTGYGKKK